MFVFVCNCGNTAVTVPSSGVLWTHAENTELSKLLSLKSGAGQNIAMHASPTARNLAFLISALSVMHDDTTDRTCVTKVRYIVFSVGEV